MTDKPLSDKEKALLILEKTQEAFTKCEKQLKETTHAMLELKVSMKCAETQLKRVLNEEENNGNIHKECKYYNAEKDYCSNYMMGMYCGMAFEVSKHKKCIKDLVE